MKLINYKELVVWQKSIDLVLGVYAITNQLPQEEKYGLCSQMQRAAVSIPSSIAEGAARNHTAEFRQFCGISYASSAELETQIIIVKKLYTNINCEKVEPLIIEIQKMLNGLIKSLH